MNKKAYIRSLKNPIGIGLTERIKFKGNIKTSSQCSFTFGGEKRLVAEVG